MQRFNLSRAHRRLRITAPTPKSRCLNPDVILSSTARFRVLIWPECTPLFLDSSANVRSLRIASRATRALNSGKWLFIIVISDRLFNQSINLNNWSKIARPSLHNCHRSHVSPWPQNDARVCIIDQPTVDLHRFISMPIVRF